MITGLAGDLAELQRLPTVSAGRGAEPALRRASAWLATQLAGLGATLVPLPANGSAPVVTAQRRGLPGAPTVLIYGHYDVVPAGPPGSWSVPPYAAVRIGRTLWGRGTSDDKGPVVAGLHAVRELSAAGRRVNLKFLYEGEEEIGSPNLPRTLRSLRAWLRDVDLVLVCDTEADVTGHPALTCSLRGELTARLTVTGSGRPLHAGRFGGAAPNPAQALAMLVAALHHPDGRVTVPGFYHGIRAPRPIRVADHEARLAAVAHDGWGEPGRTPTQRVTTRPAVVVTALCSGGCRPGPGHVIPARASALLNIRLVPDQHPARIGRLVAEHLAALAPAGTRLEFEPLVLVEPWALDSLTHPGVRAAAAAVRRTWGAPPTLIRSGGSIPAVSLLAKAIPAAAVVPLGFARHGENAHSVDEHVDLDRMHRAAHTIADLVNRLGRAR
ncbi:MAG TPA: M20/M25/M40 family metallo-hydrolase [Actinophytocola sp.]|uniref:M20/M25/M40 family metallo-hydrolase n=1 Tax=Actinophytocola sp. TaxID=1872138 RepID=UPI002DBDA171|nr:M20/M25/M40 family metallo-hydrolase [Actinophytocola sp.]HEU5473655.1 M20/M25/M40 family metallo-hydrolase [Actinophytocola sp.]